MTEEQKTDARKMLSVSEWLIQNQIRMNELGIEQTKRQIEENERLIEYYKKLEAKWAEDEKWGVAFAYALAIWVVAILGILGYKLFPLIISLFNQ